MSLLLPHERCNVKIPGTFGRQSVTYHRYYQKVDVLVGTDFCYMLSPNEVLTSAAINSSSYYASNTYIAGAASSVLIAGSAAMDLKPLFNVTDATTTGSRLVSYSAKVTALTPTLTRTGTIQGAHYRGLGISATAFGNLCPAATFTIPTIASLNPKVAMVADGQALCINYIPSDEDDFQFLGNNTNVRTRHVNNDDVVTLVIIGSGLTAATTIKLEIYANFEVIPSSEQSLSGLENYGSQPTSLPSFDVEHLVKNHYDDLLRVVPGNEGFVGVTSEQKVQKLTNMITSNKLDITKNKSNYIERMDKIYENYVPKNIVGDAMKGAFNKLINTNVKAFVKPKGKRNLRPVYKNKPKNKK